MNIEETYEVRTYFREGGKVIGTERCSSEQEARAYAKHQIKYYPYVEIVFVTYLIQPWGNEIKSSFVVAKFK